MANKEFKAYKKELELLAQVTDSPVSAMATMFGSVEGLNSILMLTSDNGMKIYNDTMKEMGTNTTALEDAYKKVSGTTQYTFKKAMEEGKNALIGFGDVMAPFIGLVAKGLSKITGAFNGLSEGQKKVFIGVGAGIAGFTGLFLGISKVTGAISGAITNYKKIKDLMDKLGVTTKIQTGLQTALNFVTQKWSGVVGLVTKAQKALNLAMKANPIGFVITVIMLAIGALVLLYKKCEWFRNGVKAIGNAIVNGAKTIANKIKEMKDKIVKILSNIRDKAKEIWENIKSFFTESIPNFCKWLIEQIKNIPRYLGLIVGGIIGLVVKCVMNIWNFITKTVPEIIGKIITWFMELPGKLWNCLLKAIEKIQEWGSRTYQKATEYASKAINAIIEWFRNLPSRIWEWLSNACQKVVSWGMDLSRAAINAGKSLVNGMLDTIKNLPQKMLDIGKDIVRGLWNGIKGMGSWLWGCITDFGSGIVDGFKSVLGIHSPSRVLRDEVGKYMAQGISVGFTNEMDDVNLDIKQSLNRTINTQLKPTIDNADIEKINARLNNNTKNEIIVLVENQTVVDGEVIESKVYKKIAKRLKGDENSYRAVRGKRGFGVA
ncbi:phage tail tape measure protein [Clostridium baratii]|uniref:phage tail tape measure protein n=1 Tax=Clostridium baratii TaxID=1561 RepID=UPI0030D56004